MKMERETIKSINACIMMIDRLFKLEEKTITNMWLSFCQEILTHKFLNISTSFVVLVYVRLSPRDTFSVTDSVL